MSSQALLKAIETAGQEELAQLEQETNGRVEEILADAKETAEARRERAYQEALRPLAAERARRLHQAQMEALKITSGAREEAAEKLHAKVQSRLVELRDSPQYKQLFRHLLEEAVQMLGEQEVVGDGNSSTGKACLEVDGRDEKLAGAVLQALGLDITIAPALTVWGGVVVRSGDGRIVVNNTLEARLAKLEPYLGRFISLEE